MRKRGSRLLRLLEVRRISTLKMMGEAEPKKTYHTKKKRSKRSAQNLAS
jgi:hypothetical protein